MRLDHEFTVPVPAAQAWPVLLDIDRIAPCMPGATITKVDGDDFEGTVKVKVGPITVTYGGTASFLEKDEALHIDKFASFHSSRRHDTAEMTSRCVRALPRRAD